MLPVAADNPFGIPLPICEQEMVAQAFEAIG